MILMNDEFDELYNMLSLDREDVRKLKDDYEKDISILLNRVRNYHTNNFDLSKEYDVENNFDKYRLDETFLNYNIANDVLEFKINLLQGMLQDLFIEKKFNEFKRLQEEKLPKNEYLEYTHNPTVRSDKISYWYSEFMNK